MPARILIVDDSKVVRRMVRETLEMDKYDVFEAVDGKEGLAMLEAHAPDLVVTDINMPEMDGLSLIRAIRSNSAHDCIPILVLSTEASDDIRSNGKDAGATGWLVKPFQADQLRDTARCALELRNKALSKREQAQP